MLPSENCPLQSRWNLGSDAVWFCSAGLQPGRCRPKGRRYMQMSHYPNLPGLKRWGSRCMICEEIYNPKLCEA